MLLTKTGMAVPRVNPTGRVRRIGQVPVIISRRPTVCALSRASSRSGCCASKRANAMLRERVYIRCSLTRQRMPGNNVFLDGLAADQVLLNDALDQFRRAGVIPDPIRINERRRTALADLQTVCLCPIDAALSGKIELFQPSFQILP